MKKILYIITRAEPGGAQAHVLELLRGFRDYAELHLASGEEGPLCAQARVLGVNVHILPHLVQPLHPAKDVRAIGEILALVRRIRPDLMHMHSSKAGLLGRIAAWSSNLPFVFTAHGWAFTDGAPALRKAIAVMSEWLVGRLGGWVIAVSEYDRRLAQHYRVVSPERIVTIHHGIPDIPPALRASREINGPLRIVMVARFAPPKDYQSLLRALAKLRNLPWELETVGDGPLLADTQELTRQLDLLSRVTFQGTRNDVPQRLAQALLFVLVSNYEGLPISILEAMRAGLPVVASNVGGVREAVIHGQTGFLVPRGDVAALERYLRQLLTDPSLMRQLGDAGRRRFELHFTVDRMLKETMAIYERSLRDGSSR